MGLEYESEPDKAFLWRSRRDRLGRAAACELLVLPETYDGDHYPGIDRLLQCGPQRPWRCDRENMHPGRWELGPERLGEEPDQDGDGVPDRGRLCEQAWFYGAQ